MTLKQYRLVKIGFSMIIAVLVSQAFVFDNYLVPIVFLAIASLLLLILRGKVREIVADERDYAIGGKSALLAMQIFSWIAIMGVLVLHAFRNLNPAYDAISMTLAFAVCFLMLLYSIIFKFHDKIKYSKKRTGYLILVTLLLLLFAVAALRIFSGEDDWICKNGNWIRHGNPSFPAPITECK